MHVKSLLASAVGLALASAAFGTAQAAPFATFTDEMDFETAIGGSTGGENFNGFAADATFRNTTVSANNMDISGVPGNNGVLTNKIDAPTLEFSGFYDLNGTAQLLGDLAGSQTMRIDFGVAVTAWGATFVGISDDTVRNTEIRVYDMLDQLLGTVATSSTPSNTDVQFYGFSLMGSAASYLVLQNTESSNDVFGMDNVVFKTADLPEPGTLAIFGLGLAGLAFARRRKTAA